MSTEDSSVRVYGYRWVILLVFSLINILIQMQWLTFAPIAREARVFYGVSALQIDLLSMIFMGVFLLICIPASYIIDTYGIRWGVGMGAFLAGVFGLAKGVYAHSYTMVIISQVGLAVAQPFVLNAATKVAVKWFPIDERATAVGIATLSQFLGIIFVMIATPLMIAGSAGGGEGIRNMLLYYGIATAVGAALVLLLLKKEPPTPPCENHQIERFLFLAGIRNIFKQKDMILTIALFFIGLGLFNAISTVIDQICEIKGLTVEHTGLVGGMMLVAGIIGALILPPISDKMRKRKPFIILAMAMSVPGLVGLTVFTDYTLLLVSSFILGFFLLGAGAPVGFQYSAEISYPSPESTSQGLLLLAGQVSGIIFIVGMNVLGMIPFMIGFCVLMTVNALISTKISESTMILSQ